MQTATTGQWQAPSLSLKNAHSSTNTDTRELLAQFTSPKTGNVDTKGLLDQVSNLANGDVAQVSAMLGKISAAVENSSLNPFDMARFRADVTEFRLSLKEAGVSSAGDTSEKASVNTGGTLAETTQAASSLSIVKAMQGEQVSVGQNAVPVSAPNDSVTSGFREQFGNLAKDRTEFHRALQKIYGDKYDAGKAEGLRQSALKGDFSFLPAVQFVDSATLKGANGAYDAQSGTVFLNNDLKSNPGLAASTFVEEAGHHIDTLMGPGDAVGDEGELFRRILSGEKLSDAQIAEIKSENDHGTIKLNGREIEVEFWSLKKAIKKVGKAIEKGVKSAGRAIEDGVKSAGRAIEDGVKSAGKAVTTLGKGVFDTLSHAFSGVYKGFGGFVSNLLKLNFGGAFSSLVNGFDEAFLKAPGRLFNTALNSFRHIVDSTTSFLGPIGKPLNGLATKALEGVQGMGNMFLDTARGLVRMPLDMAGTFITGQTNAFNYLFQGEFGLAAKSALASFIEPFARFFPGK